MWTRPFDGDTRLETLAAVLRAGPGTPAQASRRHARRLEQVIARCLEKQPSARFSSGSDLHRALAACQTSRSGNLAVPTKVAAAVLLVFALGAAALGWRSYQRAQRIKWVEETAVPEIARLIQEDRGLAALRLYREAERYSPASKSLFRVAEGVASRPVAFETNPADASIYISDYTAGAGDDLAQWESLGRSPLKVDQIPNWGYYRVRAVKAGFAPADQIFGGAGLVSMTLQPEAAVPSGMGGYPLHHQRPRRHRWRCLASGWTDTKSPTRSSSSSWTPEGIRIAVLEGADHQGRPHAVVAGCAAQFRDRTGRPGAVRLGTSAFPRGRKRAGRGVSWYEAAAYAEFAGKACRLLHEWNQAAGISLNANMVLLSNFGAQGPVAVG